MLTTIERTIIDMRVERIPIKKIHKDLGIPLEYVRKVCRQAGYGMNMKQFAMTEEEAAKRVQSVGYEYVSGFNGTHSKVTVRCPQCGHIFTRNFDMWFLRLKRGGEHCCPKCNEEQQKKRERDARTNAEQRRQEKEHKKQASEAELISRQLEARLAIHVCKNCGMSYCIEITGYNSTQYCSEKCGKRWQTRINKDRRVRRMMKRERDTDITLEKLYAKESGRCYLCGGQCDWNDVDESGNAGEMYPSIDHVIPLSKGGKHKWDNIRLAHRGCNTKKRDSISPYGQISP